MSRSKKAPFQAYETQRPSSRKKSKQIYNKAIRRANEVELQENVALEGGEGFQEIPAEALSVCAAVKQPRMHAVSDESIEFQAECYASRKNMATDKAKKIVKHKILGK